MRTQLSRLLTIATAIAVAVALTAGVAYASVTSQINDLVEIESAGDGLGTSAIEWSGATYNEDRHLLFVLDDEHNAWEFPLNADNMIDHTQTPRMLEISLGTNDFEGVAWIAGETYAFLSEGSREVIVVDVPAGNNAIIHSSEIQSSFPVGLGSGNMGPEGIATDGNAFYVVIEMPAELAKFDWNGQFLGSVDLTNDIIDASGITMLDDGSFLVVSHESMVVAHYEIDWVTETATHLATRDASAFTQLEGITVVGDSDLFLFGEDNTRKGNPGQTFSHLHGEIVESSGTTPVDDPFPEINDYHPSDVNCSGDLSIADAVMITQIQVGLITPDPDCGSGDHNGDGVVNVADAVQLTQCQVGIANSGCPDVGTT